MRKLGIKEFLLGLVCFLISEASWAQDTLWVRIYDTPYNDNVWDIATDRDGNVIIVGDTGATPKNIVIKYSSDGNILWTKSYDFVNKIIGIATDTLNNIILEGLLGNEFPLCIVKCTPNGDTIWTKICNDTFTIDTWLCYEGITTDIENNIVVAKGQITIKFDSDGNILWERPFYWEGCYLHDVAVDESSNVIVTGKLPINGWTWSTIKYSKNGDTLWERRVNIIGWMDVPYGVITDSQGNIIVVGEIDTVSGHHTGCIVKYSLAGDTILKKFFYGYEPFVDVAVDNFDNIILVTSKESNFYTIKCNPNGDTIWTDIYGGDYHDAPSATITDMVNNIIVSGMCADTTPPFPNYAIHTIKYKGGPAIEESDNSHLFPLFEIFPNPFGSQSITIHYKLLQKRHVNLSIYNIQGRLIKVLTNEEQLPGKYIITWDGTNDKGKGVCCGVYFFKLNIGDKFINTKKCIVVK